MIETFRFSRKDAVKEGYRNEIEINKGHFKRPLLRVYRKKYYTASLKTVDKMYEEVPCKLSYGVNVSEYFKADKDKEKEFNRLGKVGMSINLKDVILTKGFKNKTIYVYTEKQHNGIYTLRELRGKENYIADIEFGEFYNIVGKVAFVNLNKSKGQYKINKILKIFD